ncbi:hypothetical protein [Streptomyces carpinensis]|uniref:hypothetical protein n=1 Tax=Streptomyces carpinensis TaxID=66369 RepID=UPI003CC5B6F7
MNGDWPRCGRDGRLSVHLPSDDAVRCRAERWPDGPWDAPRRVGGDQKLYPALAVGQGTDRYAHLVSWRPTGKGESGLVHSTQFRPRLSALDFRPVGHPDNRRVGGDQKLYPALAVGQGTDRYAHLVSGRPTGKGESGLVHSTQFRPRLSALDFRPVGHPDNKGHRTGAPAGAVDTAGRTHLFVRNRGGGVSMVAQKEKGGWTAWCDLKGREVQDGLAAVTGESGRVELYAAVPGGLLHWRQGESGGRPVLEEALKAAVRPGTLYAWPPRGIAPPCSTPATRAACAPGGRAANRSPCSPPPAPARSSPRAANWTAATAGCWCGARSAAEWPSPPVPPRRSRRAPGGPGPSRGPGFRRTPRLLIAATLSPSTGRLLLTSRKDEPGPALQAWREV